jgi:uncharacterized iron-regulated membrane protein
MLLLGGSGALLVFEEEIDRGLNPRLTRVEPQGERLSLAEMIARIEGARTGMKVMSISLPKRAEDTTKLTLRSMEPGHPLNVAMNPYTGEDLGPIDAGNSFPRKLHQFHKNLLLDYYGKTVTGIGAALLLVLAVSGLVLWWPRKVLRFGGDSFTLHNALGFYSSVFLLVFGVTGLVIHYDEETTTLVNRLAGAAPMPPVPNPASTRRGTAPITADEAVAIAAKTAPGAAVTSVQGLGGRGTLRLTMRFPEDHTPAGRTNIFLDPFTGTVLAAQISRTAPPGTRVVKLWNRMIHTGDLYGWPTKLFACVASLSLPVLAITGPLIWWNRKRRRS